MPNISAKYQRGHPQWCRKIEVGYRLHWVIFDQYLRNGALSNDALPVTPIGDAN